MRRLRTYVMVAATVVVGAPAAAQIPDSAAAGPDSAASYPEPTAPRLDEALRSEADTAARSAAAMELIYSVNRTPESPFATARAVEVISAAEIRRRNARTLPELLIGEAGTFLQQAAYGAGSPVVRGLTGRQVLLFVDGVKINSATYGSGPIQYLSTIDLNMVERVEVVRGAESTLASDALGGIINVITKKGRRAESGAPVGAFASTRYSGADGASTGHAEAFGRTERVRYLAGASYHGSDDLRAGAGLTAQRATGYAERAGNASVELFATADQSIAAAYQVHEQQSVPRTDRVADGTNVLFSYEPQRRQLATLQFRDEAERLWGESLQLTAYWNRQDERRREVRASAPSEERRYTDVSLIRGASLELATHLGESQRLLYGVDFSAERIASARTDSSATTQLVTPQRGSYTDGATYSTLAAYLQDQVHFGQWATATVGARYGHYRTTGSESSSVGTLDLGAQRSAVTASGNIVVHLRPEANLIASVTRGFRAPTLDDISVFDRGRDGYDVPNSSVRPERSLTTELGAKYSGGRLSGSAFVFHSRLQDLLVRAPGMHDGLSFIDANGNGVFDEDSEELPVYQRQNVGRATISGSEVELRFRLLRTLSLFGNHTYTIGQDEVADQPLSNVPPAYGAAGVLWQVEGRHRPWAEAVYTFANAQHRLNPADRLDSRIGSAGTPRFDVFTLRGGATVFRGLALTGALENVTDVRYKHHGSGVYRPGRQVVFGTSYTF